MKSALCFRTRLAVVIAGTLLLLPLVGALGAGTARAAVDDPADWSIRRLAAQLVNVCVPMTGLDGAVAQARDGVGGITLLGTTAPAGLRDDLAAVARAGTVPTLVAADEEGGTVQRLGDVIGALPSAATMGTWEDSRIRETARRHGERMRALGVPMALSPVADLAVPGAYIASLDRAFASDPDRVAAAVTAWGDGMRQAGVAPVVKHWPGHGHAEDSHVRGARIPPYDDLLGADLVPFAAALDAGVPAVMVGHLLSDGLTEPGTPASISPGAMGVLRQRAGDDVVIMTDSLTMAAVTSVIGITATEAAVRSLTAGADWALTCAGDAGPTVAAVEEAIADGVLPRDAAVRKVRRVLGLKADLDLLGPAFACREPLGDAPAPPSGDPTFPDPARVAGEDRYATAAAVATATWPDGADTVYVATGQRPPDALAATPAAAADGAPVLLVRRDEVPAATAAALDALRPDRIVLVGGAAAVDEPTAAVLDDVAPVTRVAGADRYATAATLAARSAATAGGTVYLATGAGFADALAVGPVAAAADAPLLLVEHDRLPAVTAGAIADLQPDTVVVVGGQAAVCDAVGREAGAAGGAAVERVAGADRYATAALLARRAPRALLTTGADFPDALAAGAAAAASDGALVLVPPDGDAGDAAVRAARGALAVTAPEQVTVVGGSAAVSPGVVDALR